MADTLRHRSSRDRTRHPPSRLVSAVGPRWPRSSDHRPRRCPSAPDDRADARTRPARRPSSVRGPRPRHLPLGRRRRHRPAGARLARACVAVRAARARARVARDSTSSRSMRPRTATRPAGAPTSATGWPRSSELQAVHGRFRAIVGHSFGGLAALTAAREGVTTASVATIAGAGTPAAFLDGVRRRDARSTIATRAAVRGRLPPPDRRGRGVARPPLRRDRPPASRGRRPAHRPRRRTTASCRRSGRARLLESHRDRARLVATTGFGHVPHPRPPTRCSTPSSASSPAGSRASTARSRSVARRDRARRHEPVHAPNRRATSGPDSAR